MTDPLPDDLHELALWLGNFEAVARSHRGRFGLDDPTLERLEGARRLLDEASGRLRAAEDAVVEASSAAEGAMAELVEAERGRAEARRQLAAAAEGMDAALAAAARAVRPIAERVGRGRSAGTSQRAQAGAAEDPRPGNGSVPAPATARSGRISSSAIRLAAPADLQVTAQPNRINHLSWRGTGEPGARYLIEATVGRLYRGSPLAPESSAYRLIATVNDETAHQHVVGQVPQGVHVRYRIRVARGSLISDYSAEVTVACR